MKKNIFPPEISVVLPAYNGEKYLNESIQSILNQTFNNFEFIIINDGSIDNTLEIIKKYKKKDKRILLIDNKKNRGASESLNSGFKIAKGKYIACFCADDISHPKRLELEFNYLETHSSIFLVGSSGVYINEKGKEIRRFRKYDNYKIISWRLRKSCSILFPSIMFRNEGVVSIDKNFSPADDYNLYFELLKKGKNLTNISPFLVKIRVHKESLSVSKNKKQDDSRKRVVKKFKELKDNTTFIEKGYYSLKIFFHYIKTRNEKIIKK
ncbi:MAG: hypothetical protein QJ16_C0007G0037 [archaeon GW2011_AR1]|nr:MAG: hypothetical protein QJ16_C0007G0037 [archaeon GW2011_AR1]